MISMSRRLFLALPAAAAAAGIVRPAFAMSDAQQLVEKARLAFLDMITDDNYKEMRDYVKQSRALVIFPELIKGAFIIGAEGGSGVLVTRGAAGQGWSYPAFYTLASGSLGLQIGGQSSELVLTVMSEKALTSLINDQFKIGGNVDVAVGPVGKGLSAVDHDEFLVGRLQLCQDPGRLCRHVAGWCGHSQPPIARRGILRQGRHLDRHRHPEQVHQQERRHPAGRAVAVLNGWSLPSGIGGSQGRA